VHHRSLYKYFTEKKWADAFLNGEVLFRSLAYFRDYEDNNIREDQNEGLSIYRPDGGLIINNLTQGTTFTLAGHALESTAKQEEIFIFCVITSLTDEIRKMFGAVVCVEIFDTSSFCNRVETALLPFKASFPGCTGRKRIGHRIQYYEKTDVGSPRWALPDMIAKSKLDDYAWQQEFRLVFSLTDALEFENVSLCFKPDNGEKKPSNPSEHPDFHLKIESLRDICYLHE
jgi:hypothetical protein